MATPHHPRPGSTVSPYLLVLLEVAGAHVAIVSPGEFVPVWPRTAGGLLGLALPLMSKFPLLVVHGLGRGLEYYLGCVFS